MMDVEEFVSSSLRQILNGIKAAQDGKHGDGINPSFVSASPGVGVYPIADGRYAFAVSFDIAVTVTESSNVEAGGKLTVLSLGAGGTASRGAEEKSVTRIQFGVPVAFPRPSADS